MIKNLMLAAALSTTAATVSADVTMDDQNIVNLMTIIVVVGEFCNFNLSEEAISIVNDLFAHMSSKYSEADIGAAIGITARLIREQREASSTAEAWCAEKMQQGPLYWSEKV